MAELIGMVQGAGSWNSKREVFSETLVIFVSWIGVHFSVVNPAEEVEREKKSKKGLEEEEITPLVSRCWFHW